MLNIFIKQLKNGDLNIDDLSYTEFISLINQTNNPPNSYVTLNEWRVFGEINSNSNILEFACTTGFTSRELVLKTNASAVGIDVCTASIDRAIKNAEKFEIPKTKLSYKVKDAFDANEILKNNLFTHLILGASLKFIGKKNGKELFDHLFNEYDKPVTVLTNEFYAKKTLPPEIILLCKNEFGISPTVETYKDVMLPYAKLRKTYESSLNHRSETEEETNFYCTSTINRFVEEFNLDKAEPIVKQCYQRLHKIKTAANILRPFHASVTLVHEYIPSEYGSRYTELF